MHLMRLAIAVLWSAAACAGPRAAPTSAAAPPPHGHADHPAGGHAGTRWDEIYRHGTGFETAPNQLLVDSVRGVAPGTALDLGMGQGRNAVYLARQGWRVTGVDTSAEGVRIANAQAAAAGLALDSRVEDMHAFDLGTGRWDLIAMIYMEDRGLTERIKAALAPGGLFVLEFFHQDSNDYFPHPIHGFATGELEQLFRGYTIVRSEVVEDLADFGKKPAKLVRFIARKPAG